MKPIGSLMIEHRVIERMLALLNQELSKILKEGKVDSPVIDVAIDFFTTYADRFHHGKEERILFRELKGKPLSYVFCFILLLLRGLQFRFLIFLLAGKGGL